VTASLPSPPRLSPPPAPAPTSRPPARPAAPGTPAPPPPARSPRPTPAARAPSAPPVRIDRSSRAEPCLHFQQLVTEHRRTLEIQHRRRLPHLMLQDLRPLFQVHLVRVVRL